MVNKTRRIKIHRQWSFTQHKKITVDEKIVIGSVLFLFHAVCDFAPCYNCPWFPLLIWPYSKAVMLHDHQKKEKIIHRVKWSAHLWKPLMIIVPSICLKLWQKIIMAWWKSTPYFMLVFLSTCFLLLLWFEMYFQSVKSDLVSKFKTRLFFFWSLHWEMYSFH